MKRRRIIGIMFICTVVMSFLPWRAIQAAGTDEITDYEIAIVPQEDGSLLDTYVINWCVISDSAGPLTWITLGMPNEQYQVVRSSGDAASAIPYNQGFNYMVRINLLREVNAGECVNFVVLVHQYGMANLDESANTISMHFTPGWFNDVPVDHLQVTWYLPSDPAQVKSLNPKPGTQNDIQAVWESALQPGEKFPISIVYDPAAFPGFNPDQTATPPASSSSLPESAPPATDSTTTGDTSAPVSLAPLVLPTFTLSTCICGCVILLLVLVVLFGIFRLFGSAARSYRGGGFLGGYPRGGGWLGGGGGTGFGLGSGGGGSPRNRTGGGSGLFGGRGMSCACVSSGCACACAGGGRAGCSRKGFDVSGLFFSTDTKVHEGKTYKPL
jgi:hypothetical protein